MTKKDRRASETKTCAAPIGGWKNSLVTQLRYSFIVLVLLSLLPTGGVLIYFGFQTQRQQLQSVQQERSQAAAREIDAYLSDVKRKLEYLGRMQGFTGLSADTQRILLEGLLRTNGAYETIAILDRTGQFILTVSAHGPVTLDHLAGSTLFSRAFKLGEEFIGPVEVDPAGGIPVLNMAVPIRNRQDKVDGVLMARINLNFLQYIVSEIDVGETGYAYIIDNRNFLIAQKRDSLETFKLTDISTDVFIKNLTLGTPEPFATYRGLRGDDVLGAFAPVRSVFWNVVVELPKTEAYGPIRKMMLVMGLSLILATGVAVGFGILFSRQIVVPLQYLTDAANRISTGNFSTRVRLSSRNELGILATAFNHMVTQVQDLIERLEQRFNELKNTQTALRESETRYRAIVEGNPDLICRFLPDMTLTFVNEAYCRYFGKTRDELLGNSFLLLIPEEAHDTVREHVHGLIESKQDISYEHKVITPRGEIRWQHWTDRPILDESGKVVEFQSIGRDTTESKHVREQIKASLAEKELLLKEVYHRVKNNLQVICSLLYFQAKNVNDVQTRQLLQESESRVKAMALVHEKLYQSDDLTRIDYGGYINTLVNHLQRTYGQSAATITIRLEIADITLGIDTGVPCGLIINELVSNCFKHAFPPGTIVAGKQGEIRINMICEEAGEYILTISDNGIGFPNGFDIDCTESLGMQIVSTLVEQLNGNVHHYRGTETVMQVRFQENQYKKRI